MRDRPDKAALLQAIAHFLEKDLRPALKDPALAFRALIAANLAGVVAAELRAEGPALSAELGRLRALLVDFADASAPREREAAIAVLRRELARRIRAGEIPAGDLARVGEHVRQTLREELAVVNPRFDLDFAD